MSSSQEWWNYLSLLMEMDNIHCPCLTNHHWRFVFETSIIIGLLFLLELMIILLFRFIISSININNNINMVVVILTGLKTILSCIISLLVLLDIITQLDIHTFSRNKKIQFYCCLSVLCILYWIQYYRGFKFFTSNEIFVAFRQMQFMTNEQQRHQKLLNILCNKVSSTASGKYIEDYDVGVLKSRWKGQTSFQQAFRKIRLRNAFRW